MEERRGRGGLGETMVGYLHPKEPGVLALAGDLGQAPASPSASGTVRNSDSMVSKA